MNSNFIKDSRHPFISTTPPSFELAAESLKEMKRSIIFDSDSPNETELILGDNFEIKVEDGKTFVVRKKTQYPKTYEECCKVLLLNPEKATYSVCGLEYKRHLIVNFQRLLVCRDAYWKISGNWKPDVMYCDLYCIGYDGNVITWKMQGGCRLLVFPTEEMRDAFYENFKELIEECKKLL